MYADNTLTPKEAVRLCALGTLAKGAMHYSALANAIRHFASHITGPSLEVMGTSLELLKYEGLVEALEGVGMEDDALLAITEKGEVELRALLTANVKPQASEMSKLIVALKFRFLHLLDIEEQRAQADILIEAQDIELARLDNLRGHHAQDGGYLVEWLDHDIQGMESHLEWLKEFRVRLG
ncbi:MAG: hypothetical protein O3B76_07525 [Proteobacteria bacterium]|nr:hypothetical protein [Pseudomonadota bacterium]MDA1022201.1 hypothetical protein [Pseudomonadota bacterium]